MATSDISKGNEPFGTILEIRDGSVSCCDSGGTCCGPEASPAERKPRNATKTLSVYDPPMCCSTGVCGPNVDPALVRFAADAKWLASQGVTVERFNLAQSPKSFVENEIVRSALTDKGDEALPILLVDGQLATSGVYPVRAELVKLLGLSGAASSHFTPAVTELVAIGAAIAANCELCLRYHVRAATELGVTSADIARAVKLATQVKDVPHSAILKLAARLTRSEGDEVSESGGSEA